MSGVTVREHELYPPRSGTGECVTPTRGEDVTIIGTSASDADKSLWKSGVMPSNPQIRYGISHLNRYGMSGIVVGPFRRVMIYFVLIACGAVGTLCFTLSHSGSHEKASLRGEVERLKSRSDILAKHFDLAKQEKHDLARMILDTKSREALSSLLERSAAFDKFVQKYGFTATPSNTKNVRKCLEDTIQKFNITSMLDVPCGDGSWQHLIPSVKDRRVAYIGGDINIKALEKAKMNEDNQASGMEYFLFDSVHFPLRKPFDLILFRDVIEHLQINDALTSLLNFKESQSSYIAMTYWPKTGKDANKASYLLEKDEVAWYETNLLLPPFNFPKPLLSCENDDDGPHIGKSILGIWRLSDLPISKVSISKAEREQNEQRERIAAEQKKAQRLPETEKRQMVLGPCGKAKKDMMSMPFHVRHEKYDCGLDPDHGGCTDECPCYDPGNGDEGPHCFHLSEEQKGMHLMNQMRNFKASAPAPPELARFENSEADEMDRLRDMALNYTRNFKRGRNRTSLSEEDFADAVAHLFANQQRAEPFDGLFNPMLSVPRGPPGAIYASPNPGPAGSQAHILQRGPDGQVRHVGTMHGNKILKQGPDGQVRQVGALQGDKLIARGPDGQVRYVGNVNNLNGVRLGPRPQVGPQPTAHVLQRGPDGQVRHVGTMHGNKILQHGPNGEVRQVGAVHGDKVLARGPDGQIRQVGDVDGVQAVPDIPYVNVPQMNDQWSPEPQSGPQVIQRGPNGQVRHVGTMNGNKIMRQGPDGEMKQVGTVHGDKILMRGPDGQAMHVGNVNNFPENDDDDDVVSPLHSGFGNVFDMPDFARMHGLSNGYDHWSPGPHPVYGTGSYQYHPDYR